MIEIQTENKRKSYNSNQLRLAVANVKEIRSLTDQTFVLVTDRNHLEFDPGQWVRIGLENDTKSRKYSIYSSVNDQNLEFLIREVSDGYLTPRLKPLQIGDKIEIVGPKGQFLLNRSELAGKKYLFISTGTGIAPFHSMISSYPGLDYLLLHGVGLGEESYHKEQYQPDNLIRCTSRDNNGDFNGRVTDYLKSERIDGYSYVYLCGNSEMIKESISILKENGYTENQIRTEVYF
jgi:ferredoxin/flavodoxin---NADP+ reductase